MVQAGNRRCANSGRLTPPNLSFQCGSEIVRHYFVCSWRTLTRFEVDGVKGVAHRRGARSTP